MVELSEGLCYYCGEKTNDLLSNGSHAIWLSHEDNPGVVVPHHAKCISVRLSIYKKILDRLGLESGANLETVIDAIQETDDSSDSYVSPPRTGSPGWVCR